eukprot:TRINITY_DN6214_c0_g1_i1.p1 TRINITY_DN6214_c0_g1~~TRINITY_DN6214_c0_g1_i1.p1  ORF type:complete len:254 (-),score=58.78 TRINITY_DN6214_c0_g1_i1:29-790(-)
MKSSITRRLLISSVSCCEYRFCLSTTRLLTKQIFNQAPVNNYHMTTAKRIKIYTKTGDGGTSSLFNGERRPKTDELFEALGDSDELNSCIGVAAEYCRLSSNGLASQLEEIQSILLDMGAHIATPRDHSSQSRLNRTEFPAEYTNKIEQWIDNLDESLPPLRNFILPGGGLSSAHLHVARSVCRRTERHIAHISKDEGKIDKSVSSFINRLSDYLFVAARFAAMKEQKQEIIYKKPKSTLKSSDGELSDDDKN